MHDAARAPGVQPPESAAGEDEVRHQASRHDFQQCRRQKRVGSGRYGDVFLDSDIQLSLVICN